MKAVKIILKILIILLASVWGVFFGILTPIIIMGGDLPIANHYILKVWIIAAAAGYFMPCFLAMLGKAKTAAVFSAAGTAMTLYLHTVMSSMFNPEDLDKIDASFMYLPQIFMTVLTILYIFVINPHYLSGRNKKINAPAPSIFDDK